MHDGRAAIGTSRASSRSIATARRESALQWLVPVETRELSALLARNDKREATICNRKRAASALHGWMRSATSRARRPRARRKARFAKNLERTPGAGTVCASPDARAA
jgi:hypothetical protein